MSVERNESGRPDGFSPSPKQIVGVVVGVLALVFALQNNNRGTLAFLFFEFTAPVWISFTLVLAAGAVFGFVARGVWNDRRLAKKAGGKKK